MKTRTMTGILMATTLGFQVLAQENDDLYFNSKDREKQKTENVRPSTNNKIDEDYNAFKKKHFEEPAEDTAFVNPTDSYSARTINPEYIARSNSEQASEDEQNYYVEGYTPNTFDSYSAGNSASTGYPGNYNSYYGASNTNWNYGNSWSYPYTSSYYPYSSWYSPYYGVYCNPGMSPYYSGYSGWTLSLGYTWGNYGSYGYSPYYYSPYSYGYGGYPGYYYYGRSENTHTNFGKRPSRHSAVVIPTTRVRSTQVSTNSNGRTTDRSRSRADEYYVKPSRRAATNSQPSEGTRQRYSDTNSSYDPPSRSRESYSTPTRESRSYSTPSRSSSPSHSTPSRSSGNSSGSRSRGNN